MLAKDLKVLVVDDMRTMRILVQKHLETMGFTQISQAEDGATALQMLADAAKTGIGFHLVFCDWDMENGNGMEVLRSIRADSILTKLIFVMVTAKRTDEDISAAFAAGCDAFIRKPFDDNAIPAIVGKLYASGRIS